MKAKQKLFVDICYEVITDDGLCDVFMGIRVERRALSRSFQSVFTWKWDAIRLERWKSYRFE
jgi:hypothetical protein